MIQWYRRLDTLRGEAKIFNDKLTAILRAHSEDRAKRFQSSHYIWDYQFILSNMPCLQKGSRVLDAGGGHGALQFLLARDYDVWNIDRRDYSDEVSELNLISNTNVRFIQSELAALGDILISLPLAIAVLSGSSP